MDDQFDEGGGSGKTNSEERLRGAFFVGRLQASKQKITAMAQAFGLFKFNTAQYGRKSTLLYRHRLFQGSSEVLCECITRLVVALKYKVKSCSRAS